MKYDLNDNKKNQSSTYRKTEFSANNGFFDWTSSNLPSNAEFYISDIDSGVFAFRNRCNTFMLVEIKCFQSEVKTHQRNTFSILHKLIKAGIEATNGKIKIEDKNFDVCYLGFHLLQFEKTDPTNGKIFLNNKQITESQLINFLSLEDPEL